MSNQGQDNISQPNIIEAISLMIVILPFFRLINQELLLTGLSFATNSGVPQSQEEIMINPYPSLALEIQEKEHTMKILRAKNKEMEDLLASMEGPRTKATSVEKSLILEFTELIYEMVIILMPRDLEKLELTIIAPSPTT